jgi:hypothetical protein
MTLIYHRKLFCPAADSWADVLILKAISDADWGGDTVSRQKKRAAESRMLEEGLMKAVSWISSEKLRSCGRFHGASDGLTRRPRTAWQNNGASRVKSRNCWKGPRYLANKVHAVALQIHCISPPGAATSARVLIASP